MTDQTDVEVEDDEDEDENYYEVEYTITIKGTLTASSKDVAESMADAMQTEITVDLPSQHPPGWDSLEEGDFEYLVWDQEERAAEEYRWRQQMAQAVEESASEPGD